MVEEDAIRLVQIWESRQKAIEQIYSRMIVVVNINSPNVFLIVERGTYPRNWAGEGIAQVTEGNIMANLFERAHSARYAGSLLLFRCEKRTLYLLKDGSLM